MRKLRAMLMTYREAGGEQPILLMHDEPHGAPLIEALARFGDGLPAHVLPFAVNEITQVGLESIAAAFAYGASAMRFLLRARPRTTSPDCCGRWRWPIRSSVGLGFGAGRVATIETDDPDLSVRGVARNPGDAAGAASGELPHAWADKRNVLRFALSELHRAAPAPVRIIALPAGAPFGAVEIDVERLHAMSVLRVGLPDRRVARRSRAPDAALCRRCLRAVRPVPGDLPRGRHHTQAADRFRRRPGACAHPQAGGAVLLHSLQQAVRGEEHDRSRRRQARRQALDVQRQFAAHRRHQDVRRLPGRGSPPKKASIPTVKARLSAPPTIICASARRRGWPIKTSTDWRSEWRSRLFRRRRRGDVLARLRLQACGPARGRGVPWPS